MSQFQRLREKAKDLTEKVSAPSKDMVFAVRKAIEDVDSKTFQDWYTALSPAKRTRLDKAIDEIKKRIHAKARQRTDARIATAGRLPEDLTKAEYDLIYQEERDELMNAIKKGVLEGAVGIALASVGINIWF